MKNRKLNILNLHQYNEALLLNKKLNAILNFLSFDEIEDFKKNHQGLKLSNLSYAMKANVFTKFKNSDACSNILKDIKVNEEATIKHLLDKSGAVMVGKSNADELACGSENKNSCYGEAFILKDDSLVNAGGSSGGSGSAAKHFCDFSIGTETGGSCRYPAHISGIYALKPTFGVISRFGVVDYGSSLDCVGIIADETDVIERVFKSIAIFDEKDNCMVPYQYIENDFEKFNIVILNEHLFSEEQKYFVNKISNLSDVASIKHCILDLDIVEAIYFVISSIEFMSNTYKYDSIKYVNSSLSFKSVNEIYKNRYQYLSYNSVRKILQGSVCLVDECGREIYYKALTQRKNLIDIYESFLKEENTIIISPNAITNGDEVREGNLMIANLVGAPSFSYPVSLGGYRNSILLGARRFGEDIIFNFVKKIKNKINNE